MIFDLSGLSTKQKPIIEEALSRCTFPFDLLLPRLQKTKNKSKIPVDFIDCNSVGTRAIREADGHEHIHIGDDVGHSIKLGRKRILGLAWYSGRVSVDITLENDPQLAIEVFLAEGAHMVDFFYMTDTHRKEIFKAFHGDADTAHGHSWFDNPSYWDDVGESFMAGFTMAYSDVPVHDASFSHRATPEIAKKIKQILTPSTQKYFTTRYGKSLHQKHAGLKPYKWYNFIFIGATLCRTCKPK